MSFPTTLWGNTFDIYTAVPGPTASSPSASDGPVLGNAALLADGSLIQFVQFVTATSTLANLAVIASTSFANYKVTASSAANQLVVGVNDLAGGSASNQHSATSGAAVLVNYCAWITRKGLCFPVVKANCAADKILISTVTAGALGPAVAGTDIQGTIVNLVVVGGADAVSPALQI